MDNIKFKSGDLFKSDKHTLVNTVNCVGVMGAGVAKKAKQLFPSMYEDYSVRCDKKSVQPGVPYLWKNPDPNAQWILNFPTKNHWRYDSKVEWIENGLDCFLKDYKELGISSIAFSALGCGRGGLWWVDVKPIMEHYLRKLDIPVEIYRPQIKSTEKAVMHAKSELLKQFKEQIQDIELVRSIHTGGNKWYDWTKANTISLRIVGIGQSDSVLDELQSMIFNKYNVKILFKVSAS